MTPLVLKQPTGRFGDASSLTTGLIDGIVSTSPNNDDGNIDIETQIFSPPQIAELVLTLTDTLESLRRDYAGNDQFSGDPVVPYSDQVYGYGGNDRLVMTYGN